MKQINRHNPAAGVGEDAENNYSQGQQHHAIEKRTQC